MSLREQRELPHVELGPRGHYLLPPITRVVGGVTPLSKEPVRIHVRLATGHELDIPVIRDAIESLVRQLSVHLSDDFLQKIIDETKPHLRKGSS
jgi:hypothetical protein